MFVEQKPSKPAPCPPAISKSLAWVHVRHWKVMISSWLGQHWYIQGIQLKNHFKWNPISSNIKPSNWNFAHSKNEKKHISLLVACWTSKHPTSPRFSFAGLILDDCVASLPNWVLLHLFWWQPWSCQTTESLEKRRRTGRVGGWSAWATLLETKITMEIPSLPGTLNNNFLMDGNG